MKHILVSLLVLFTLGLNAQVTFQIDTDESRLFWEGKKLVGSSHDGYVKLKSGETKITNEILEGSFVIDMNTIVCTDIEDADKKAMIEGHLKDEDFFDVANHPTASFSILGAEQRKDENTGRPIGYYVLGSLEIKGISHPIEIPVDMTLASDQVRYQAEFTINRTKWGVEYGSGSFFDLAADRVIDDKIYFKLDLVGRLN